VTKASTFFLVRHAESEGVHTTLAGRMEGVPLTQAGHQQARELARRMAEFRPQRIIASPRQRAQQTAAYLPVACDIPIESDPAFDECDFGAWTGMPFEALASVEEWKRFNQFRSGLSAPQGESIADVQHRAVEALLKLHTANAGQSIVIVTHADVIRSVLAFFCGMPLDFLLRLSVDPASVSIVDITAYGPVVRCINRIAPHSPAED
jgi:broad specificity phosphatase PhoE